MTTKEAHEKIAQRIGNSLAEKLFEGRKGHGAGPVCERHLDRATLEASLIGAAELALMLDRIRRGEEA